MSDSSQTAKRASNKLQELVDHVKVFPPEAFLFIREGLAFSVEKMHGPETDAHRKLYEYMSERNIDWSDLSMQFREKSLATDIASAVEAAGGVEKLNRHVSGRDLCWGLRDYALRRWGMLARCVLESWSIKTTEDFGRIVFGFIELNLMQKQAQDTLDDFQSIYDFKAAFDETFSGGLRDLNCEIEPDDESDGED